MKATPPGKKIKENDDLDLSNPYSKITCLILYLYSMELGSPPLYYEINRVCRTKDKKELPKLGPYIMALGLVTSHSEQRRDEEDKIKTGKMLYPTHKYNLAGLFMLYRGAVLQTDWV